MLGDFVERKIDSTATSAKPQRKMYPSPASRTSNEKKSLGIFANAPQNGDGICCSIKIGR
jgi:hypothetical protein